MSKTIMMHTKLKAPDRMFRVINGESVLTLRVNKKRLMRVAFKLALSVFFVALFFTLVLTYRSDSPYFWPLAKSTVILGLVFIIANQSILNN